MNKPPFPLASHPPPARPLFASGACALPVMVKNSPRWGAGWEGGDTADVRHFPFRPRVVSVIVCTRREGEHHPLTIHSGQHTHRETCTHRPQQQVGKKSSRVDIRNPQQVNSHTNNLITVARILSPHQSPLPKHAHTYHHDIQLQTHPSFTHKRHHLDRPITPHPIRWKDPRLFR
jgi:hypothetical protein